MNTAKMSGAGKKTRHIVALSGGKDSTAMALRLSEVEPQNYEYICTKTGNELPEMVRWWEDLGRILGKPLVSVTNGKTLIGESLRQNCLPSWRIRWCTRELKIKPFQQYLLRATPCVSYVGIRSDEVADRDGVDHSALDGVSNRYPMVEWGWTQSDVIRYLDSKSISIPERTDCALCFYQRISEYWRLWKYNPDEFAKGEEIESLIGHTFRSESKDSWPASMKGLREAFESGARPKGAGQGKLWTTDTRSKMCSFCSR